MFYTSGELFDTSDFHITQRNRAAFITVLALILAIALPVAGNILPLEHSLGLWVVFTASILVPAVCLTVNLVLTRRFKKRADNLTYSETQDYILSHRERAEETARKKLALLRKLRRLTSCYSVILGLFGVACAISGGGLGILTAIFSVPFSFFLILATLSGLNFPILESFFDEVYTAASEKDYPELYKLAYEASEKIGCNRKIKIILIWQYTLEAMTFGKYDCIIIGMPLLNQLCREEFYAALLHEFAHLSDRNRADISEREYSMHLSHGTPHYLGAMTGLLYSYLDTAYIHEFNLYNFAAALSLENYSDRAMAIHGCKEAVASVWIKLFYYKMYAWENYKNRKHHFYASEKINPRDLYDRIDEFNSEIAKRSSDWEKMIDKEIISRTASHPTTKMRLEALGVRNYSVMPSVTEEKFEAECQKALSRLSEMVTKNNTEYYDYHRKHNYLDHIRLIEKWEREGKPLDPENYFHVIKAMREIRRNEEADNLCIRAIAELSEKEAAYAHLVHGYYLLREYKDEGIEHIYTCLKNNRSYLSKGLERIEEYCLITGNTKELERCRKKGREQIDNYNKIMRNTYDLKKKIKLVPESLPDGMLEEILNRLREIDTEKQVSRMFIARNNIDDEFRTMVVLTFKIDTNEQDRKRIMWQLHCYLDTSTDWPFALRRYEAVAKAKIDKVKGSLVYKG